MKDISIYTVIITMIWILTEVLIFTSKDIISTGEHAIIVMVFINHLYNRGESK